MTPRAATRILDANANRALEGLRVCEDIVRFALDDAQGYRGLRALRHHAAAVLRAHPVSAIDRLRARASLLDPGRRSRTDRSDSLERLLLVNFQRVKEALRVLEEVSRLLAPRQVRRFQALRFRTYDAERRTLLRLATVRHS